MSFELLQRVRILESAEEYSDMHGQEGVVVSMKQMPDEPLPSLSVLMKDGSTLEDLFPADVEPVS